MMKKRDRADALRRSNYLDKWSGKAREVIEALLDKYADIGFIALDEIETVKTPPVSYIGEPLRGLGVVRWSRGIRQNPRRDCRHTRNSKSTIALWSTTHSLKACEI